MEKPAKGAIHCRPAGAGGGGDDEHVALQRAVRRTASITRSTAVARWPTAT